MGALTAFLARLFQVAAAAPVPVAAPAIIRPSWPDEDRDQYELRVKFGDPERVATVRVPIPWAMQIHGMPGKTRSTLNLHPLVAESAARALDQIRARYTDAQMRDLGIDVFGGDHVVRQMRGADRWSLHSWGIAIDFDPARNALGWGADRARLARPDAVPFWEAWEAEGWCSLGRAGVNDWMHVQAARRNY